MLPATWNGGTGLLSTQVGLDWLALGQHGLACVCQELLVSYQMCTNPPVGCAGFKHRNFGGGSGRPWVSLVGQVPIHQMAAFSWANRESVTGITGNEGRVTATPREKLVGRAEVGARMECREPFWEQGQGLDTCGKKGQKELFHLCVEVPA